MIRLAAGVWVRVGVGVGVCAGVGVGNLVWVGMGWYGLYCVVLCWVGLRAWARVRIGCVMCEGVAQTHTRPIFTSISRIGESNWLFIHMSMVCDLMCIHFPSYEQWLYVAFRHAQCTLCMLLVASMHW